MLAWYVIISIGASQNVIDGVITENSIFGLILLLGVPTGVYLYFKYKTPKNKKQSQTLK